jgi:hypothetical protein
LCVRRRAIGHADRRRGRRQTAGTAGVVTHSLFFGSRCRIVTEVSES